MSLVRSVLGLPLVVWGSERMDGTSDVLGEVIDNYYYQDYLFLLAPSISHMIDTYAYIHPHQSTLPIIHSNKSYFSRPTTPLFRLSSSAAFSTTSTMNPPPNKMAGSCRL